MQQAIIGAARENPRPVLSSRRGYAEFYVYTTPFIANAGTAQLQFNSELDVIRFDSDADFELQRLSMFVDSIDTDYTQYTSRIAQLNINIRDEATGRLLFGDYINASELFGIGRTPFVLPTTHFFKRATQARIVYAPMDPGPDFDNIQVYAFLIGRKHFEY